MLIAASSEALGCERDAPTAMLPGFTEKQADERARQLWSDWAAISHYRQTVIFSEEASRVYLARVTKVERDDGALLRTDTTVEPLRGIKGTLPTTLQTLTGFIPDSCGGANGDGDGVYSRTGDLIIVFEGVAKQRNRPNGITSVKVTDLRNVDLLDEVQSWLNTVPGYKPYD